MTDIAVLIIRYLDGRPEGERCPEISVATEESIWFCRRALAQMVAAGEIQMRRDYTTRGGAGRPVHLYFHPSHKAQDRHPVPPRLAGPVVPHRPTPEVRPARIEWRDIGGRLTKVTIGPQPGETPPLPPLYPEHGTKWRDLGPGRYLDRATVLRRAYSSARATQAASIPNTNAAATRADGSTAADGPVAAR